MAMMTQQSTRRDHVSKFRDPSPCTDDVAYRETSRDAPKYISGHMSAIENQGAQVAG